MSSYSNLDSGHLIYTLATFRRGKQYYLRPPLPKQHDKRHIDLLDDIALLLVKDLRDVVAVSMEIYSSKVVFLYAKDGTL